MKCGGAEAWVSDAVEEKGLAREGVTLRNTEQRMQREGGLWKDSMRCRHLSWTV